MGNKTVKVYRTVKVRVCEIYNDVEGSVINELKNLPTNSAIDKMGEYGSDDIQYLWDYEEYVEQENDSIEF